MMETEMSLAKKFAIAATMALPLLLSGCGTPATELCAPGGPGTASLTQTFTDAAPQKICHVSGDALKAEGRYVMHGGSLLIDGNVPARARIEVDGGKLFVNGDVGAKARLTAKVPEDISSRTVLVPMMIGKVMTMQPRTRYTFEGYSHPGDTGAAIAITGNVEIGTQLTSNHGIAIGGRAIGKVDIEHTREHGYDNVARGPEARAAVNRVLGL